MAQLADKRILLGVTGGIAAYKSAELLRRLQDEGADVRVVMTKAATEFITPLTMQALSGHPVHLELLSAETESVMGHIELARWADLILVAPATADFMARFAQGHGDDLLTAVCLAADSGIAIAPAMNQAMWGKAATQNNLASATAKGVHILEPGDGLQACGEVGEGRLMEVPDIVSRVIALFPRGILSGKHVVITAGPTQEAIDPVRYISNRSSGKQGYAIATAALEAGAQVTLVSGPTHIEPPERATTLHVQSAQEMLDAVMAHIESADIFIGVAAVADYRPQGVQDQKIKKTKAEGMTLELVQNPDILACVAALKSRPFTVGFAAETQNLVEYAKGKLKRKKLDMIVANNVADQGVGFESDDNHVEIIGKSGEHVTLAKMPKAKLAREIITFIAQQVNG